MRERVQLFGGELEAGPRPGGGFLVRAWVPTETWTPCDRGPIRVLIADDQALMRTGFRMILDAQDDIEVVAEAIDGADAIRQFERSAPNVVVMDVRMPTMDGIEATRRLTTLERPARVLILTTFDLDDYVYEALRAGASGFLLKDRPPGGARGGGPRDRGGRGAACAVGHPPADRGVRPPRPDPLARGARRAHRTRARGARPHGQGLSNAEIARALFVAETTVKTHVGRVLHKLRLRDRAQGVVLAYESGLVQPGRVTRPVRSRLLLEEDPQVRTRGPTALRLLLPSLAADVRDRKER